MPGALPWKNLSMFACMSAFFCSTFWAAFVRGASVEAANEEERSAVFGKAKASQMDEDAPVWSPPSAFKQICAIHFCTSSRCESSSNHANVLKGRNVSSVIVKQLAVEPSGPAMRWYMWFKARRPVNRFGWGDFVKASAAAAAGGGDGASTTQKCSDRLTTIL